MTNKETAKYLSYKRKFIKNRLLIINFINLLFLVIELIFLLYSGHYVFALILFALSTYLVLISFRNVFRLKSVSDSYYTATYTFINTYVIIGLAYYIFLNNVTTLFLYIISFLLLTLLFVLVCQKIINFRIRNVMYPRFKFSESFWVLVIGLITISSESVIKTSNINDDIIGLLLTILWVVVGTYTIVDIYSNYKLSRRIHL